MGNFELGLGLFAQNNSPAYWQDGVEFGNVLDRNLCILTKKKSVGPRLGSDVQGVSSFWIKSEHLSFRERFWHRDGIRMRACPHELNESCNKITCRSRELVGSIKVRAMAPEYCNIVLRSDNADLELQIQCHVNQVHSKIN